jgi:SPP1 gp7 family putative phage head morphogenesis protein
VIVDLKALLKARGRKRDLTLRPINTTKAQARALARLYAPVMQVWAEGAKARIIPAYARSLASFTGDSPADIEAEIEATDEGAVRATFDFRAMFQEWAESLMAWHVNQLASQLTYSTNVDVTTPLGGARGTVADALARNTSLIRNVSDEARGRISDIVFRGLQNRTPVRDVAAEINKAVGLGRARSLRIASDQTVKLSASLDELRQRQLGFDSFIWRHSGKVHFRPEHKDRDGQAFSWDSEVAKNDPPGYAPFCGCKAIAHMSMDEEDAPPTPVRKETAAQRTARLNEEARDYVITNGKRDNFEYLYAFDKSTGEVIDKYTSNAERFVSFTPAVVRAISDPKRKIVVRHNHPSSTSLSGQDTLMMGEFPGMAEMVADGIDGSYYHAARARKKITQKAVDGVQREVRRILQRQVNDRTVTPEDASKLEAHLRNVRLNTLGYLKYTFRFEGDTLARVNRNKAAIEEAERWLK